MLLSYYVTVECVKNSVLKTSYDVEFDFVKQKVNIFEV